eukprot:TRINITY_DN4838_c0_g2_i1.p1 TRINITY_DN4838_c0_g2~~TRINITY_DN4838_c0_g2_i1.p1  ORF type:complete len:255 (-),score=65.29 TRINITY_DN4838_c0_g2_i1:85-849(-)
MGLRPVGLNSIQQQEIRQPLTQADLNILLNSNLTSYRSRSPSYQTDISRKYTTETMPTHHELTQQQSVPINAANQEQFFYRSTPSQTNVNLQTNTLEWQPSSQFSDQRSLAPFFSTNGQPSNGNQTFLQPPREGSCIEELTKRLKELEEKLERKEKTFDEKLTGLKSEIRDKDEELGRMKKMYAERLEEKERQLISQKEEFTRIHRELLSEINGLKREFEFVMGGDNFLHRYSHSPNAALRSGKSIVTEFPCKI